MKTKDDLLAFLAAHGVAQTTYDHPAVFTVGESGAIHQDIPGAHTKNLFLKDAKGQLWLVSAEGHKNIQIEQFPVVNLSYADIKGMNFISISLAFC